MRVEAQISRQNQRGAALLIVLWTALLLSVVLAGALGASRIEAKIAAARKLQFEARLALEAALDLAAWRIAAGDYDGDGPIVSDFDMNGFTVRVERSIESEKLDINRAGEQIFSAFFRQIGLEQDEADRLAAEIADWRDEDDLARPNGAEKNDYAATRSKYIGDRPFNSLAELKAVLHMTPGIYDCALPTLTLFGSGSAPSARVMALMGKEGISEEPSQRAARLGTSVRGATAGGVHAIEAVAVSNSGSLASQKLTRIFRVSGRLEMPLEQVAEFRPSSNQTVECQPGA